MITIISAWYNEEFLAPLFLEHYSFADRIIIMLDESTNDGTIDEIKKFMSRDSFISFRKLHMPDGLDDKLKQRQMNEQYRQIEKGWVIEVDSDEFIKIPEIGMKPFLSEIKEDVVLVMFWQMYQNSQVEKPLDNVTPVFEQRQHGIRNRFRRWNKPCVVRAGRNYAWGVGHHDIVPPRNISSKLLFGAHWSMADTDMAIARRIYGHKNRQSKANYQNRLSVHNHKVTEEEIINKCDSYKNCPPVVWAETLGTKEDNYYKLMAKKGLI